MAACLVRKQLAPKGFTGRDYQELVKSVSTHVDGSTVTPDVNGEIHEPPPLTSDTKHPVGVLPGGVRMDEPEVIRCEVDPSA